MRLALAKLKIILAKAIIVKLFIVGLKPDPINNFLL